MVIRSFGSLGFKLLVQIADFMPRRLGTHEDMVSLRQLRVPVDGPHREIPHPWIFEQFDHDVRTTMTAKHALMIVR